jgi:TadE-like protein
MLIQRFRKSGHKANVTLEFALVAVFLLLPLLAGGADFAVIISAQAQLNTALQALDYFGWTNPTAASNLSDLQRIITAIDNGSVYNIPTPTLSASISYGCFSLPATALTTIAYQATTCSSPQTQQTLVTYKVTTSINLPMPFPGLKSPWPLSATGTAQIQ